MPGESRSVVVRLSMEASQYIREAQKVGALTEDAMTKVERSAKRGSDGVDQIGRTSGRVALVAAAGFGAIIKKAADFDQAMSNVQAATHESESNMKLLRQAALDAGQETVYSATESAGAIEELAKAGISTADIMGGGLKGSLNLAAAGGLAVGDAAEIAATALTQFKLGGEDVEHVADLLAAGAGKAQGSVTDLGMALKQSGLVAAQTGLTVEETTGTLAAFASAGLIGSDAGTSFKTMLQALTPNSKQARDTLDALGISAYDAQGNFIGMTEFAGNLRNGLKDLSVEQQNAALKTIFGSDAVRAASVIYDQGAEGIQGWIDKTNDTGYAAETAATRLDNLKGDVEQLTGALETAFIKSGEGSQGQLRTMVQGLTEAVNLFNKLPGPIQGTVTSLLAITAITGGALWFGSKVIGQVAETRRAIEDLGGTSTRSSKAIRGIAKAGEIAAAGLAGLAIIDQLQVGAAKALPGVEQLTGDLIKLSQAGGDGDLPKQFDDLSHSIERLSDPNKAQALQDNLSKALGGIGGGSELKNARAEIDALDAALTNLVSTRGASTAEASFAAIAESAGLSKGQIKDLTELLPDYKDALAGAANEADLAASATDGLAGATEASASANEAEATALIHAADAMRDKRKATGAAFDAETQYRQALKDAREQADKTSAGIRGNSDEVLENRNRLSALRDAWNNQSQAVKNNRARFREARDAFIETATAMGVPEEAARKLARQLLEIPESRVVTVVANTGNAVAAVQRIKAMLNDVPKTLRTDYYVNQINSINKPKVTLPGGVAKARGGQVRGPGTSTSDSIPVRLSDREYVVQASAVDRVGVDFLDAVNNGGVLGFAGGGLYSKRSTGSWQNGSTGSWPTEVGEWSHAVSGGLKELQAALKQSERAVDRERRERDKILDKRSEIASGVKGAFTSDLFGTPAPGGFSGAPASNPLSIIRGDIKNAQAFQQAIKNLEGRGLKGDLAEQLIGQAEDPLAAAQQLQGMTDAQIKAYAAAVKKRNQITGAVGQNFAQGIVGDELKAANKELRESQAVLRDVRHELHELRKEQKQNHEKNRKDNKDNSDLNAEVVSSRLLSATAGGRRDARRN